MKRHSLPILFACLACLFLSTETKATDFYLGASLGKSRAAVDPGSAGLFDTHDEAFKLTLGIQPLDWFAIEATYLDLGEIEQTQVSFGNSDFRQEHYAAGLQAVFLLEAGPVDLYAKAGLTSWEAGSSGSGYLGPYGVDDEGVDFAWGIGLQHRFGAYTVRAEYDRIDYAAGFALAEPPDLISIGFTWGWN